MESLSIKLLRQLISYKKSQPEKIAVVDLNNRKTNYEEFINYINSAANFLLDNNVEVGDVVSIEIEKSMEHYALRLACHFIGAIFLSMNPNYPEVRKQSIYNQCCPKFIVNKHNIDNICIKDMPIILNENIEDTSPGYIVYTSGSTGKPKGILHDRTQYKVFENTFLCVIKKYLFDNLSLEDDVFFHASLADTMFIMSNFDVIVLLYGGQLFIPDKNIIVNPYKLKDYFVNNKISTTLILPSLLNIILPLNDLVIAWVGGESAPKDSLNCNTNIFDSYGASECGLMYLRLINNTKEAICFPGSFLTVSNKHNNEILYSGPGTMIKYIDNDKLTNQVLEKDTNGNVYYHTCDKGFLDKNKVIRIIGRLDNVYKISGHRVDTADIEYNLLKYSNVKEVVAKVFGNSGNKHICVFYSTRNAKPIKDTDIKNFLSKYLPSYAIPNKYVFKKEFKKNQNGKIDRVILDKIESDGFENVVADNNVTQNLLKFVKKYLNACPKLNDNLYNYGLSSLACIQILSELNEINLNLSVEFMLNNPTINSWAKYILVKSKEEDYSYVKTIQKKHYPLLDSCQMFYETTLQLGYLAKKLLLFNLSDAFVVRNINMNEVKRALQEVADAHVGLKAKFVIKDNKPYMLRRDNYQIKINAKKIDFIPNKKFWIKHVKPYDIFKDELLRISIYEYNKDTYVFLDANHFLVDGGSVLIFIEDFIKALKREKLAKENYNYFDISLIQYFINKSQKGQEDIKYYKDILNNYTITDFKKKKTGKVVNGAKKILKIRQKYNVWRKPYLMSKVEKYCSNNNINVSSFFLAAFMLECARFNNLDHVLIGGVTNNRNDYYSVNTIACLFGGYALLYKHKKSNSFLDVAKQMDEQNLLSYNHKLWFKDIGSNVMKKIIGFNFRPYFSDMNKNVYNDSKVQIERISVPLKDIFPISISIFVESDGCKNYFFVFNFLKDYYSKKYINKFVTNLDNTVKNELSTIQ